MSRSFAEITGDASTLPQGEQLKLARTLLERSEAFGDVGVEAAWDQEIERRIHNMIRDLTTDDLLLSSFEISTSGLDDDGLHHRRGKSGVHRFRRLL